MASLISHKNIRDNRGVSLPLFMTTTPPPFRYPPFQVNNVNTIKLHIVTFKLTASSLKILLLSKISKHKLL